MMSWLSGKKKKNSIFLKIRNLIKLNKSEGIRRKKFGEEIFVKNGIERNMEEVEKRRSCREKEEEE